jgi:hypothetical protein
MMPQKPARSRFRLRGSLESLFSIIAGNVIYYLFLLPHLPDVVQHKGFQIDLGLLVDFAVCVVIYGLGAC